jgi:carboxyl-terminal processing protease
MREGFSGEYGGIGVVVTMRDDKLTVVSPFDGTPGGKAGLQGGDVIKEVNGEPTAEMTMQKAVSRMKGKPGTNVTLTIFRETEKEEGENETKEFEVEITRANIEVPFTSAEMKGDNIGYIQLTQFIENSGTKIKSELDKLRSEGAEAFILDLRRNPGGLLGEAVGVASNFFDGGKVVTVRDRNGKEDIRRATAEIKATDAPLVVLVNGESASASEIIAGAVQDRNRATVVGTQTFGKGVVQNVIPLSDGSAVRLTTARYYTPDGNYINEKGIKPDIEIEYDLETDEDDQLQKAIEHLKEKIEKQNKELEFKSAS